MREMSQVEQYSVLSNNLWHAEKKTVLNNKIIFSSSRIINEMET